jgi:hypothetical protein
VIEFPRDADGRFANGRPLVWIDDELTHEAHPWAAERMPPARLIDVDPAIGLTEEIVARIAAFLLDEPIAQPQRLSPNPRTVR